MGVFESLQSLDDNGVDLIVFRKMDELEAWAFVCESYKAQSIQLDRPSCIPAAFDLVLVTPFLTWNQADISFVFALVRPTASLLHSILLHTVKSHILSPCTRSRQIGAARKS